MEIKWLTAYIDQPQDTFETASEFWLAVTGTTRSPLRGEAEEFATLIPKSGDAHLRMQRTRADHSSIHLDLHVSSVSEAGEEAEALGAMITEDQATGTGYLLLSSPGGLPFCFVPHHGESTPAPPVLLPTPNAVDQISIDVPANMFDAEIAFWSSLTGWEAKSGRLEEFAALVRPQGMPLRVLIQRLGEGSGTARAHLDLACGDDREKVADAHVLLGAERVGTWQYWTSLRDPTGMVYCVTARDPGTGVLS